MIPTYGLQLFHTGIRCLCTCDYWLVCATVGPGCAGICGEREESKQETKKSSHSCEIDAIGSTYPTLPTMSTKMDVHW